MQFHYTREKIRKFINDGRIHPDHEYNLRAINTLLDVMLDCSDALHELKNKMRDKPHGLGKIDVVGGLQVMMNLIRSAERFSEMILGQTSRTERPSEILALKVIRDRIAGHPDWAEHSRPKVRTYFNTDGNGFFTAMFIPEDGDGGGKSERYSMHELLQHTDNWVFQMLDKAEKELTHREAVHLGKFSKESLANIAPALADPYYIGKCVSDPMLIGPHMGIVLQNLEALRGALGERGELPKVEELYDEMKYISGKLKENSDGVSGLNEKDVFLFLEILQFKREKLWEVVSVIEGKYHAAC